MILIALSTFFFTMCDSAMAQDKNYNVTSESFPTNLNKGNFNKIDELENDAIAFEGTIIDIQTSRNNTPFYKININDSNFLWVVLMYENKVTRVGDRVRVLGYLSKNEVDKHEKELYLTGKYCVIGFGLVDYNNNLYLFPQGAESQKMEWLNGKIPNIN